MLNKFRENVARMIFKSSQMQTVTKTPPEKMQVEEAWYNDSDLLRMMGGFQDYNPDELVAQKGHTIYRKMIRDAQVKAAYDLRVSIIISRGWRFDVKNDDQQEMADMFEAMITNHFVGTWIQGMRSVLLAKAHGFSITEKIFDVAEIDKKTRWVVKALKPKPFYTFTFDTDNFGNIKRIIQNVDGSEIVIRQEKVVLMINHPELDAIWGESDLRAVYRPYWEKDITLKLKNIYLERLAGGFVIAQAQKDAPNLAPAERAHFEKVLSRISQKTAIRAPQGYEIDVKHGPATSAFDDSVSFNDQQILRGLLIPNLMGFADMKNGSRALGDTQLDAFMMTVQEEGDYLADIMNEQIFAQVAWWNFGRKDFPRFLLDGYTTTQKRKIAETWNTAVKDGTVINTFKDENRTRKLLLYPAIQEDEWDENQTSPSAPVIVEPVNDGTKKPDDEKPSEDGKALKPGEEKPEKKPTEKPAPQKPEVKASVIFPITLEDGSVIESILGVNTRNQDAVAKAIQLSFESGGITLEDQYKLYGQVPKEVFAEEALFTSRVNFVDIENKLNQNEDQFVKEMGQLTITMHQELEDQLKSIYKGLPEDKTKAVVVKASEGLALPSKIKSEFKQTVKNNLRKNYELGRNEAQLLLKKSLKGDVDLIEKMSVKIKFATGWKRVCSEPNWTVKHFVEGLLLESAEKFFEEAAFKNTADINDVMLGAVRQALTDGVTNEESIEDIIKSFREAIPTLIGTPSKDGTISKKSGKARLETIARTSISNIFTQAQLALYNDPALGDFVQGMEYSAVMDKRTTDTCNSLDGRRYPKDDPIWSGITPPNHFNCRSVLIPITLTDGEVKYSGKKT